MSSPNVLFMESPATIAQVTYNRLVNKLDYDRLIRKIWNQTFAFLDFLPYDKLENNFKNSETLYITQNVRTFLSFIVDYLPATEPLTSVLSKSDVRDHALELYNRYSSVRKDNPSLLELLPFIHITNTIFVFTLEEVLRVYTLP